MSVSSAAEWNSPGSTVKKILHAEGLAPTVRRGQSWREFLRTQVNSIIAGGFLPRRYRMASATVCAVLYFELGSRRVHVAGCTAHPDEAWVTQQARQVSWGLLEREEPVRFLIRDRDREFTSRFDAVFEAQGVRVVRTPVQAPEANGIAERFVRTGSVRMSGWLLIRNTQHLEHDTQGLRRSLQQLSTHRSLGLVPPNGRPPVEPETIGQPINVRRRDRLGGLLTSTARGVSEIGFTHLTGT